MNTPNARLQLGLEDILGDLQHARRSGDVGRLALLAYCDVRRWARQAGEDALAERSTLLVIQSPLADRDDFLAQMDGLIQALQDLHARAVPNSPYQALRPNPFLPSGQPA